MPTIEDFLQHAYDEYEVGKGDTKFHIGELEPQVEDTEDGVTYWLKPLQRTFFGTKDPVFNLNDWSFYQLCKRLSPIQVKLDPRYIRACSPALGLKQLRFWREVFKEREALLRLKTDPHSGRVEIRGILSGLYHPLDAHMVGNILKKELKDREIEYAVTPRRWNVTFWEDMQSDDAWYHVGFRVMGSEVGAIRRLRMDVLLRFRTEKGRVILPVLINSRPLAAIPYSNNGVTGLPKLTDNFQRGLTVASSAKEAAESRMDQELAYPADEFMDVVTLHRLPQILKALPIEKPKLFEEIKTKFDLACLLGKLANEATGKAQTRIESSAALYMLTGRAKTNRNRNEE